jgi:radical SAM superfamily enzyme YgiQ (UPF0313 family)
LPQEALEHGDAVVIGEAEPVWGTVLSDLRNNTLKQRYQGEREELDDMPTPLNGMLKGRYPFRGVFTSRGCVHKCSFCSVQNFFGKTVRYRPIEDVVRDVNAIPGRIWYNGDDNIWGPDIQRTIDLYKALADGPKKWWFGQGDLVTAQRARGDEMLHWAYKSGLRSVWVGYESERDDVLGAYKAKSKQGKNREEALIKIQEAGMEVVMFVILGDRQGKRQDFDNALELSDRLKLTLHPILLTPYPATELYDEYKPYIRDELSWESFDGVHGVFHHDDPDMTPFDREHGVLHLNKELFTWPRIRARIGHINKKAFPVAHLLAFMKQMAMRRGFNKAYEQFMLSHHDEANVMGDT